MVLIVKQSESVRVDEGGLNNAPAASAALEAFIKTGPSLIAVPDDILLLVRLHAAID